MSGRFAADRVLAALLDDERDEGALAFEVLEARGVAADRDDLPRGVAERVEEERALLADDVAHLLPAQLPGRDGLEQPVVQPGVRLLRFGEELLRELR